ncbi:oligosaccharide flippase family protein [Maribellus maritimus]|uniref:oligosaccharide flippase family protein n=1 Tax=Maribellus maritimus TaxID=2870838 RepID=UPI001EEB7E84|nr:oligosaccharide flippase family protein [Maribellus maritimus]MCG6186911.1 oligosaccharide flippase family protein [Maribellus maritimus]
MNKVMLSVLKKIIYEKNVLSLSTSVIGAILGLASFMLLTRGLEKELFGDWVLFTTLATFFDQLRFGLTSTALVRFSSGTDEEQNRIYLGTSFKIGIILVGILSAILIISYLFITHLNTKINNGYLLFLKYYPILALFNLSWNNATSYFQAKQKFKEILIIKIFSSGSFVLFLIGNNLYFKFQLTTIVFVFLLTNFIPSIWAAAKKWDGLFFIRKSTRYSTKEMLNFGRFSMGTLIGSSLLKSADTIIIGLSPILGSIGVAKYAIPLKLTDLLGIPLRSFTITAFPKMAQKSLKNDLEGVKKIFYEYSGTITFLFIPMAIFGIIFAEPFVLFLGGNEFRDSIPLLATIFRIFALYSILLPIDRFTGIALDSINRPHLNFYKVIVMTLANIIGDVIAVFFFKSLEAVALVTVAFTFIGILIGYQYLNKELHLKFKFIFSNGWQFFKKIYEFMKV